VPDVGQNEQAPIKALYHRDIWRKHGPDGQPFKRYCPVCLEGVLLVRRHPGAKTYNAMKLSRYDSCVLCAQRFKYLDDDINGEPFAINEPDYPTQPFIPSDPESDDRSDVPNVWQRLTED